MAKVVANKFESDARASGELTESVDSMLRRFKKVVREESILDEVRRKQYFVSNSDKRREKSKRARILALKSSKKKR